MTKHGPVIQFPPMSQCPLDVIHVGRRVYQLRPGSLADQVLKWVTVAVDDA